MRFSITAPVAVVSKGVWTSNPVMNAFGCEDPKLELIVALGSCRGWPEVV